VTPVLIAATCLAASCTGLRPGARPDGGRTALAEAESLVTSDPARALARFDAALASPALKPLERDRARFGAAVLRLWPDPELRDLEKAGSLLRELQAGQAGVPPLAVTAASSWLLEIAERAAERTRLESAVTERTSQLERERNAFRAMATERQQQSEEAVKMARNDSQLQVQALREEVTVAYRQLAEARSNLAVAQAEIRKKDVAIQRLTSRALKQ
jgi:hypothetical protein